LKPEIAVLDITMRALNSVEAARTIQKASPNTQLAREVVETGVRGWIEQSDTEPSLLTAIEALAKHELFFTARATELVSSLESSSYRSDYWDRQNSSTPRGEKWLINF
jgi:DNA-binding NarL/FixJ family response regulator